MRAFALGWWGVVLGLAAGCGNPCESVCEEMAAVARSCDYSVSGADVDQCVEDQADVDRDTRRVCRQYGDREVIVEQYDCEVLDQYFRQLNAGGE